MPRRVVAVVAKAAAPAASHTRRERACVMRCHLSFFVLTCGFFALPWAVGQQPHAADSPPAPEQPSNEIVIPLSEPAQRWIEDALQRQASQPGAPAAATGDPILDEVLDVIRRRGSVLNGSALDPQSGQPATGLDQQSLTPAPAPSAPQQNAFSSQGLGTEIPDAAGPDARFHVAESLLRSARQLAALGQRDQASERLVSAMREQAAMLLLEHYSQDANGFD